MRISPVVLGLLAAIVCAVCLVWTLPEMILTIGIEPTGQHLRDFYQARTVYDLPESIRALIHYQYPFAVLFAFSGFGAVYFWLTLREEDRWIVAGSCLMPIASHFLFFPILLSLLIIIGSFVGIVQHYRKANHLRFSPYLYCCLLNAAYVAVWLPFLNDTFGASTS